VSRPALGLTQPPIQWEHRAFDMAVKRPGPEVDHSPPPSTEVQNEKELIPPFPHTTSWSGA
jgi:hypothetical protein